MDKCKPYILNWIYRKGAEKITENGKKAIAKSLSDLGIEAGDRLSLFDYANLIEEIYSNYPKTEAQTGYELEFSDTLENARIESNILGNTVQDGTPAPDDPVDIQVVTGENIISINNDQSYTIDLGTIELCKIGDYQDYIYKSNNKWYIKKEIGKITLKGDENWVKVTNSFQIVGEVFPIDVALRDNTQFAYSNYYKYAYYASSISVSIQEGEFSWSGTKVMTIGNITDTLEEFINWLSTNKPVIYYPLATPTDIEITDSDLIEDLEALYNAKSYDNTTIITVTSDSDNAQMLLTAKCLLKG